MERDGFAAMTTFLTDVAFAAGTSVNLSEAAAHHARVRRLEARDAVRLTDGAGKVAHGTIVSLGRDALVVEVDDVVAVSAPAPIHLRAPVADRDRMLWLAEKAAELGISSWQAVRFERSASVSPRGEGPAFVAKLRARMISAVEQSGGAWLPTILPDAAPEELVVGPDELPVLLDASGAPLASVLSLPSGPTPVILLGPEGGLDKSESWGLQAGGWKLASLASTTLRFETAGIAAVAVCRALRVSPEG